MNGFQFGIKLFYELSYFHSIYQSHYPALEFRNLYQDILTNNINLDLFKVFLHCVGYRD